MAAFDQDCPIDYFRCGIWRLKIAAEHQKKGYGKFAVEAVLAEARRRGEASATVLGVPGEHSPEPFYLRRGFQPPASFTNARSSPASGSEPRRQR
ncbi:GNAT family N-acetyltransferase [Amycolatopsis rubida]|uniref:GNAT family N-acetyltransferase n=1 Tax=Amycolatopsis TaxID=1813 RepID=UPI0007E1CD5C|nr:Acetyltransferase (GNAT) family protein [Amycolatopsis sp. M39]